MEPAHLVTLLLCFFFATATISFVGAFYTGEFRARLPVALIALVSLAVVTVLGSWLEEGQNLAVAALARLVSLNRPHVVAAALGFSLGLPWVAFGTGRYRGRLTFVAVAGLLGTLVAGCLFVVKDVLSPYLPHPQQDGGGAAVYRTVEPGFVLETVAQPEIIPIRIAADAAGRIFVSGQQGIAAQSGAIVELVKDADGSFVERTIATALNRPYGMAIHDGGLYVSRSGQYTKWTQGRSTAFKAGAVTLLRDVGGDGVMDFYHDVVTGLPGSRGPDYLHQNNAIVFGPDGSLFITSGISSDAHPPRDDWEGTILRASPPDFEEVEVFAKGLRNTFGLAIGPDGELFATDNDANSGPLGNTGDKFVHVRRGDNFGHPYADSNSPGVKKPVLVSPFALGGIAYVDTPDMPEPYRGSIFVASIGEGRILRYELTKTGGDYTAVAHPFAVVPGAVDVAAAPNGDLYVATYAERRIVRIRYAGR